MDNIRVLVVEDNLVVQRYLKAALAMDERLHVVGMLDNGSQVLEQVLALQPDIVLLDLFLPGADGLDVIAEVMACAPCPIVVISSALDCKDMNLSFEAQRLGAVEALAKPQGMNEEAFRNFSEKLVRTVRIMSQVKVTRRKRGARVHVLNSPPTSTAPGHLDLLVIGSSTGGPAALFKLLSGIGPSFPFSILIAQHIMSGSSRALCNWLCSTGCDVRIAEDGEPLAPGIVYLAADDRHLTVGPGARLRQQVCADARFFPSVDLLFESVAKNYRGRVCAMVLTGMGDDGAIGIRQLYQAGAYTLAEAQSSCVIYGMPKAAIDTGAIRQVAPLPDLVTLLRQPDSALHFPPVSPRQRGLS